LCIHGMAVCNMRKSRLSSIQGLVSRRFDNLEVVFVRQDISHRRLLDSRTLQTSFPVLQLCIHRQNIPHLRQYRKPLSPLLFPLTTRMKTPQSPLYHNNHHHARTTYPPGFTLQLIRFTGVVILRSKTKMNIVELTT
jgi:hypothetical protein